jgi:hypothetical protein
LLKAAVDGWRISSIAASSMSAIGHAVSNIRYETGRSLHFIAIHSLIATTSIYRGKESFQALAKSIDTVSTDLAHLKGLEKALLAKESALTREIQHLNQEKRTFSEMGLLQKIFYEFKETEQSPKR